MGEREHTSGRCRSVYATHILAGGNSKIAKVACGQVRYLNLLLARRRTPRPAQGILHTINETLASEVKGFVQESERSLVHRRCSRGIVRVGRYEDYRYIETQMRQALLQL